ncbi:MAG: type II toxin-antitoxin system RelE/ParE family toxin [Gemmataceae bacterium]
MSLPVVLRAEAQTDFDEAFDWYEAQRPGLGIDFAAEVQKVFDRISANPLLHGMVFQDVRKAIVQRFPYSVLYRAESAQVLILAVFHGKRDPSIWQGRV